MLASPKFVTSLLNVLWRFKTQKNAVFWYFRLLHGPVTIDGISVKCLGLFLPEKRSKLTYKVAKVTYFDQEVQ